MKRNIPHHYSYNFRLNLDKLPTKESDRLNLRVLLPGMVFGLILVLLGIFELGNHLQSDSQLFSGFGALSENNTYHSFLSPTFFDVVIIILGLGIVFSLVLSNLRYKKIFFDGKKFVMILRTSFGKKVTYTNSVNDFIGVMFRVEFVQCGFVTRNRYIIELQHKFAEQSIPLYISTSGKNIRQIWVDYAQKLNLPTLLYTDEGIVRRDVPDLNKSLKEMAEKWKLYGKFNPAAKHSYRIAVKETPNKIIIKSRKILWDALNILTALCIAFIILTALGLSLNAKNLPPAFLCTVYLLIAGALIVAVMIMFRKDKLVIKKDKIVNTHKYLTFSTKHDEIMKKDIKGIYVTFNPATERYFVTITSSEKNIIFGKKLPIKDLKWVRDFLIENIITQE